MLYLSSFDFNKDNLIVTISSTESTETRTIESDDKIKEVVKNTKILGIQTVCGTLILTEYNKELIKLLNKKGQKIGIKAHLRNWIEAEFIGNNAYEYTFRINGETINIKREYLIMQGVKIDVTDRFKSEPKEYKDVEDKDYFYEGYVKETVQPTPEELRIEAEQRRKAQEQYRLEQEQKKIEEKNRLKEERKAKRAEEKLREKELANIKKRELEAQRLQEKMRNTKVTKEEPVKSVKEPAKNIGTGRKFRVPTSAELKEKFKPEQFYKGFKILKNKESGELAIIYMKGKPIYCKLIKGYVPSGGSLVVPIDSIAAVKRWLNAEFYS